MGAPGWGLDIFFTAGCAPATGLLWSILLPQAASKASIRIPVAADCIQLRSDCWSVVVEYNVAVTVDLR